MYVHRLTGAVLLSLWAGLSVTSLAADSFVDESASPTVDTSSYFRVFLKDGTSIVSYGEMAQVADRVVFSMPTSASASDPALHLVDIPAQRVDWERTDRYSESARAARYLTTRAEFDYAKLSGDIENTLNQVALTADPRQRLALVEAARRALADWPAAHFGYKQGDIRQMLDLMDEAILDLRAAAGAQTFDVRLSTTMLPPVKRYDPLLPLPTARETIEQTIAVAALTSSPAARVSLLTMARSALERDRNALPPEWVVATSDAMTVAITREVETDRTYQALTTRMVNLAAARARVADVKGVAALMPEIERRDTANGKARPETVSALLAAVQEQLDAARRLKLARDRWALRLPELRAYSTAIAGSVQRLQRIRTELEDIKSLSGSTPANLTAILSAAAQNQRATAGLVPPAELRDVHNVLQSATQLAESAARIRREAALTDDMARAWDASSAAAGALMLATRAADDLQAALRMPQLPR